MYKYVQSSQLAEPLWTDPDVKSGTGVPTKNKNKANKTHRRRKFIRQTFPSIHLCEEKPDIANLKCYIIAGTVS